MKKDVFCIHCKYSVGCVVPKCEAPLNVRKVLSYYWAEKELIKKPEELNAHNDCAWYKEIKYNEIDVDQCVFAVFCIVMIFMAGVAVCSLCIS